MGGLHKFFRNGLNRAAKWGRGVGILDSNAVLRVKECTRFDKNDLLECKFCKYSFFVEFLR